MHEVEVSCDGRFVTIDSPVAFEALLMAANARGDGGYLSCSVREGRTVVAQPLLGTGVTVEVVDSATGAVRGAASS